MHKLLGGGFNRGCNEFKHGRAAYRATLPESRKENKPAVKPGFPVAPPAEQL